MASIHPCTAFDGDLKKETLILMICCLLFCVSKGSPQTSEPEKAPTVLKRSVLLKAGPEKDWVGRGRLAVRDDGTWLYFYLRGRHHGSHDTSKTLHLRFSKDGGRSWTKRDTLPDGSPVDGMPVSSPDNVAFDEVGLIRCPNGDLLALHRRIGEGSKRLGCRVLLSTDGGASWSAERILFEEAGGKYALDYATAGGTILAPFIIGQKDRPDSPDRLVLMASADNGHSWEKRSTIGGPEDGVNETGVVHLGNKRLMITCRTAGEQTTLQRYSDDLGRTWGSWKDITEEVNVVQQPRLRRYSSQPGRVYLFGRNRYKEKKQRNGIWWSDDGGTTWTGFDVDESDFRDTGYGDALIREDGKMVYLGYRGRDERVQLFKYLLQPGPGKTDSSN